MIMPYELGLVFEKKKKLRYSKDGKRQQEYVCSKEGFPWDSDHLDDKKFKKLQTRTGCEASIKFTVTNSEWKVTHFNSNHNHELVKPEKRPFLRSNKKITDAQAPPLDKKILQAQELLSYKFFTIHERKYHPKLILPQRSNFPNLRKHSLI